MDSSNIKATKTIRIYIATKKDLAKLSLFLLSYLFHLYSLITFAKRLIPSTILSSDILE